MNKDNFGKLIFAVVVLVAVSFGAYLYLSRDSGNEVAPGAITIPSVTTTTHATAQQHSATYAWEYNVVESLAAARNPLRNITSTTVTIDIPALGDAGSATSSFVTSTAVTGVVAGDFVLFAPATSTVNAIRIAFSAFGCGADTVCINGVNASTSVSDPANTTYNIRVLPNATFVRPESLKVSTSATPYAN